MDYAEIIRNFLNCEVSKCSQAFVLYITDFLKKEHRDAEIDKLTEMMLHILIDCIENETIEKVRYIQISIMRSRALSGQSFFVIECYGDNFFLDEPFARETLDFPWIYDGYSVFCDSIEKESRKYVGKITADVINRIKLIELINCKKVIRLLLGDALVDLITSDEFRRLSVGEGVQIQLGDYRGEFDLILKTDEQTLEIGELLHGVL